MTICLTNLCSFIRAITCVVLLQSLILGGKDKMGDGTPKGLPLICRFFQTLTLSFGRPSPSGKGQRRGKD